MTMDDIFIIHAHTFVGPLGVLFIWTIWVLFYIFILKSSLLYCFGAPVGKEGGKGLSFSREVASVCYVVLLPGPASRHFHVILVTEDAL